MPGVQPFLISEAVRGEGAFLRNAQGRAFMPEYDPAAELAPRDVVARAILTEMNKAGTDHVYLDVTHLPPSKVTSRFPQIYRFCLDHGLDITTDSIPVSPAAHYTMGGVRTNTWGETNIRGLYACGEAACTGVHGANRLASNSLLETIVFAKRVVQRSLLKELRVNEASAKAVSLSQPTPAEVPTLDLGALQSLMWDKVGIVRDGRSLAEAKAVISAWQASFGEPTDRPSHELANLLLCARLVTEGALMREESRGAHYRSDFPRRSQAWHRHIVFRRHG